jgi:hypothetical protein
VTGDRPRLSWSFALLRSYENALSPYSPLTILITLGSISILSQKPRAGLYCRRTRWIATPGLRDLLTRFGCGLVFP